MQRAVERRRLLAHREAAQHLAGMIPKRRADLREYDVAVRHAPRRGKLRRHAQLRIVHGGRADEMDDVGAALAHIGALDQIAERALVKADRYPVAQGGHAAIAQPGADAQPVDLFLRLHASQPHIGAVEVDDVAEARGERRMLGKIHRADDADAILARAALLQRSNDGADGRFAAPRDLGLGGEPLRQRRMIDPLHEQRVALARRKHADRLHRHRPLGEPLHRGSGAVRPVEYEMVAVRRGERRLDRDAAARHLGRAVARIFRLHDRLEPRRQRRPRCGVARHALARAIGSGLAARRSSTSLPTAIMSTLPLPSTGSFSSTQTSDGIIRSDACFVLAKA